MNSVPRSSYLKEIDHTYAHFKSGSGNRYLRYADTWGGFYVEYESFPLELVADTHQEALAKHPALTAFRKHAYFDQLQKIYRMSLPEWRGRIRLTLWNRETSKLEIWQATDKLRPFPRAFISNLFDQCKDESELPKSKEWRTHVKGGGHLYMAGRGEDFSQVIDHLIGPSGCRFLPAERICESIPSETLYAPIDTLSVLQSLNRWTFAYMTAINPPGVPWPDGIFEGRRTFIGPDGPTEETGYGRFVREYLDGMVEHRTSAALASLSNDQLMKLICATLNPLLVETAAMLFALDVGMVIDSGCGKGRQGIDVIAVCGPKVTAGNFIQRLAALGVPLHEAATRQLLSTGILSFQCKGFDGSGLSEERLLEFRPMGASAIGKRTGISLLKVLALARDPDASGLHHLNAWLNRMCDIVAKRNLQLT